MNSNVRIEHDTMGEIAVPADKLWGAQTQRSFENFKIGDKKIPTEIIRSFALLKKAAAGANVRLGVLSPERGNVICRVSDEILSGDLDDQFPLAVYQTGSGTQSNMNVNEVIANRGNMLAGERLLHPNDHVNRSQSSNDTFPTAMHIAAVTLLKNRVLPAAVALRDALVVLEEKYADIVKTGRTHLQDAVPLTLGQEISGWRSMLDHSVGYIEGTLPGLYEIALGGTAVGTGLNAPAGFDKLAAGELADLTGLPFVPAENKFHALSSKDAFCFAHGALKALAADLMKIANDVRWLSSGPRCGLGELKIPENEPGSSIMPGKVNPTQCEAVTMVAVRVMGNDVTVGMAASQGNFQLNVFMPVMADAFLESGRLLADCMESFRVHCVEGILPDRDKISENLKKSLMLVTALNPVVGYENAAKIAKTAFRENITLREAAVSLKLLTAEEFDRAVVPEKMAGLL